MSPMSRPTSIPRLSTQKQYGKRREGRPNGKHLERQSTGPVNQINQTTYADQATQTEDEQIKIDYNPSSTQTTEENYLKANTLLRPQKNSPLPRIPVQINGQTHLALIDSGAAINVLRSDVLPTDRHASQPQTLQMACGTATVQMQGKEETTLTIGKQQVTVECQKIRELSETIILGIPFMLNNEVVLDFRKKLSDMCNRKNSTNTAYSSTKSKSVQSTIPNNKY